MSRLAAYKIIQNDILERISAGVYQPGTQLPTEADFMRQYDVSRITVQRALNELKQQGVLMSKPRTGTFIRETNAPKQVEGLNNIRPFRAAERINLGIVAPFDMASSGIYQYLNGIMDAITPSRDSVALHNTRYNDACERKMIENCLEDGCSGIIYYPGNGNAPPIDLLLQMASQNYPCVLMDKHFADVALPCVQTDNVAAGREITSELISNGHKKIVFLLNGYESSVRERYTGFCQVMNEAGLASLKRMCYQIWEIRQAGRTLRDLVNDWLDQGVTAVCCSADLHAKWLLEACKNMDVDVPGQLAIGSFDGTNPGVITSMLQPYEQIGRVATEVMLNWILTGNVERTVTSIPGKIIRGITI